MEQRPTHARYWVVVFALALAMIMYIQRVAISVAAVPISTELHLSNTAMGSIFGAFGLSYAFFELPMGLAGDRLGVRRVLAQIVLAWSAFTARIVSATPCAHAFMSNSPNSFVAADPSPA